MANKAGFYLSVIANIALCGVLGYWFLTAQQPEKAPQTGSTIPVIVITPATHPSLEAIEHGFVKQMHAENPAYQVVTFNANGSQTLLRSQIEEAINQKPAVIVTIGTGSTLLARELMEKRGTLIPQIFAAVAEPESVNLAPTPLLNGSVEQSNYELTMEVTPFLVPNLKHLLLIYNPQQGTAFKRDFADLQMQCAAKNITLDTLEVFSTSEIYAKTSSVIAGHEAVVIFKDNTTAAGIDSLVKLCNQQQIPLIAHHQDAFEQGASICFGSNEADYGTQAAILAHEVISKGRLNRENFDVVSKQLIRVHPTINLQLPQALTLIIENLVH